MATLERLLPLFCIFFLTKALSAQPTGDDFFTRNYGIQGRLAEGLVFDILQDKQGFLWFATEFGLVQYDGHALKTYKQIPNDEHSLAGNVITALAEDAAGNLWVGTMSNGLHYFNRRTEKFTRYRYDAQDPGSLSHNKIEKILVRANGQVWVTTDGGGVNVFDEKKGNFRRVQKPAVSSNFTHALLEDIAGALWLGTYHGLDQWEAGAAQFVHKEGIKDLDPQAKVLKVLAEDPFGGLWLGLREGGLFYFDPKTNRFSRIPLTPRLLDEPKENHVWDILPDHQGNLWVATDGGLFHLTRPGNEGENWQVSTLQLSANKRTLSLCESRDGVVWVGTNEGVFTIAPRLKQFLHFQPFVPGEEKIPKRGVSCLFPAGNGQIWVGTISGLFQFDATRFRFHRDFITTHPALRAFETKNIAAVYSDRRGNLWISTITGFNTGFDVFYLPAAESPASQLTNLSSRALPFRSHITFNITEDAAGDLWFANGAGLLRYTPATDSFQVYRHDVAQPGSPGSNFATAVFFSRRSGLWVATNDAGLDHFDPAKQNFTHFTPIPGDSTAIGHQRVLHIREDRDGRLWLGTEGGLGVLDPTTGKFRTFDTRHGLPENEVNGVLQDVSGFLWLSTPHGISRFDPQRYVFTHYDADDGIRVGEFWDRTSYQDARGQCYFGGDKGLAVFHPDSIRRNLFEPPVVFTDFLLSNKSVLPDPASLLLPEHINFSPGITLRPGQNVFTIHFAALSYIRPGKTQYAIYLEGFENNWQYIGARTEATYTNLDPGRYRFRVKAANNDGLWNETGASLDVLVLSPWYRTWWAVTLFVAAVFAAAGLFYHASLYRRLAQAEARRLRDLDEFKSRFYTNITHEFRTPLTLILGPVESALKKSLPLDIPGLETVRRSGRRLLQLVNQMLDLGKLDAGSLKIHLEQGDVAVFLRYVADSFHSLAASKNIQLLFHSEPAQIVMDFDREKMTEIIGNLLSNALKFTPEGGAVAVHLALEGAPLPQLVVRVRDTGPGISEEKLPRIFDRFYTGSEGGMEGTGIGLALAKELTALLGGTISAARNTGTGTVFTVTLPVHRNALPGGGVLPEMPVDLNAVSPKLPVPVYESTAADGHPQILIIEDNADVTLFIAACLKNRFQTIFAANGKEGVEKAQALIPDLIISDVMMPEMDGLEATRLLKTDERTSHIPVILLTARADMASRLEGLGRGADAYLAKPFHEEELLVHVEKLLELRRSLQAYYLKKAGWMEIPVPGETATTENIFLQKVRGYVETHLDEPDYSVEHLSRAVGMSHSQLHRKMVALTGHSTHKFVRTVRLQKAKELLQGKDLTIAEIAYETGFSEPGYFTKVFVAEFGVTPSEWRK